MKNVKLDLLLKARNHMAEMETSSEAISTPDIIKEIDDFIEKNNSLKDLGDFLGVVYIRDGKVTVQRADYIDDGWFVEINQDKITLLEIPEFGGNPIIVNRYVTLIDALEAANKL